MEELKLTPGELAQLIKTSQLIGSGCYGTVFKYNDHLIKLDTNLYSLLRANDIRIASDVFDSRYRFYKKDFADVSQIETLANKQKDIVLTKMPRGIVRVNDIVPGIVIPYHEGYQDLEKLSPKDYKTLLIILKKSLLAVKELADNEICHTDLLGEKHVPKPYDFRHMEDVPHNIMYKGDDSQIIDLDGERIMAGKSFQDAKRMYDELGGVILSYFKANNLPIDVKREDITDESKAKDLIDELEHRVKGM